jgi:hypothetical protein
MVQELLVALVVPDFHHPLQDQQLQEPVVVAVDQPVALLALEVLEVVVLERITTRQPHLEPLILAVAAEVVAMYQVTAQQAAMVAPVS